MIETIELDFDVSLNTMMIRYAQLQNAFQLLQDARGRSFNNDVHLFLIDNVGKEIEHMNKILNKEIPNEIKATEKG